MAPNAEKQQKRKATVDDTLGKGKAKDNKQSGDTTLSAQLAELLEKLFDDDGCMRFSFGYIDSSMTRPDALAAAGIVIPPGGEPCVPVPKAWSIDEPLVQLIREGRPGLLKIFTQPFFSSSFKLYTKVRARSGPC